MTFLTSSTSANVFSNSPVRSELTRRNPNPSATWPASGKQPAPNMTGATTRAMNISGNRCQSRMEDLRWEKRLAESKDELPWQTRDRSKHRHRWRWWLERRLACEDCRVWGTPAESRPRHGTTSIPWTWTSSFGVLPRVNDATAFARPYRSLRTGYKKSYCSSRGRT